MIGETTGLNDSGQDITAFEAPDLTPQDYTEHVAGIIANSLEGTKLIEVVETKANLVNQIHLLCRVRQENERELVHTVVDRILTCLERSDKIESFIGKEFMRKRGKVVYAWVFSFASEDLKELSYTICEAVDEARPRMEVLESPLIGPGTPQSNGSGKGARPVR